IRELARWLRCEIKTRGFAPRSLPKVSISLRPLRSECWRAGVQREGGTARLAEWSPQRNVAQPSFRRKRNANRVLTRPSVTSATGMERSGHGRGEGGPVNGERNGGCVGHGGHC